MKMKSIFSSLNAKLALAVLAVGTMFASCYDSENGDVTVNPKPDPAKYVIAGNLTDAATNAAVSPATTSVTVTIDGTEVTVNNDGYFVKEDGLTAGSHVVEVIAVGYDDAKRTIYLPETADGGIAYGNADFVLYGPDSKDLPEPESQDEATMAQAAKLASDPAVVEVVKTAVESLELTYEGLVANADGTITLTASGEPASKETGNEAEVKLPLFDGFISTIGQNDESFSWTKAITAGQYWNAAAAKALNKNYGLTLKDELPVYKIVKVDRLTIVKYTVQAYFDSEALSFNGKEGIVMYQNATTINVSWESHDSHDGHVNSHGPNNGAGGGSSM